MVLTSRLRFITLVSVLLMLVLLYMEWSKLMQSTSIATHESYGHRRDPSNEKTLVKSVTQAPRQVTQSRIRFPSRPSHAHAPTTTPTRTGLSPTDPAYPPGLKPRRYDKDFVLTLQMKPATAEAVFLQYLNRVDVDCADSERMGAPGDGGWNICVTEPYKPDPAKCLVYSFGINNDWSFDDSISLAHGCLVRSFDPTMKQQDHKHSQSVWFYRRGLSGGREPRNNFTMKSFGQHLRDFDEDNMIVEYLKFDIEFMEWESLEAMFREKSLTRVKQLAFEIHTRELAPKRTATTVANFTRFWAVLERLKTLGFRKWYSHMNPDGKYLSSRSGKHVPCCYELVYININYFPGHLNLLPPLELSHSLPERIEHTSLSPSPLGKSTKPSQSPGGPPPPVRLLLNQGESIRIRKEFQILTLNLSDIPEHDDDIHPALGGKYAASLFLNYIQTNQVHCSAPVRLGNQGDGGWDVCITSPYNLEPNCTVYSFGTGDDWSFDDTVAAEHQCNVYAFDPTMKETEHTRMRRIRFFPLGLGGDSQAASASTNFTLKTFKQLLKKLNHAGKVIDIVKIDIEHSEWQALDTMAHDGSLPNVKQLMFEIHTEELFNQKSVTSHFVYYWRIIRNLHKLGFRLWHSHTNKIGPNMLDFSPKIVSCCYELYFLNINFM